MRVSKNQKRHRGRKPTATDPMLLDWYSSVSERYRDSRRLSLMEWYQALVHRARLCVVSDEDQKMPLRHWLRVETEMGNLSSDDPLTAHPHSLPLRAPVAEQTPFDVLALAKLYAASPFTEYLAAWTAAQGAGTDDDVRLRRIMGKAPGIRDLWTAHRAALDISSKDEGGARRVGLKNDCQSTAHLTVDLRASDTVLKEWFEDWLKGERVLMRAAGVPWDCPAPLRRKKKSKPLFDDAERASWTDLRVLNCIDIGLAAKAFGVNPPTAANLGAMLFPEAEHIRHGGSVDTTDRIRQSTRAKARWLLSSEVLAAMFQQAVAESRNAKP